MPHQLQTIRQYISSRPTLVLGLLLAVGLWLRFYHLSSYPPGISGDELFNAIDANQIGWRHWPVYFPGNNGREALFLYLMALSTQLFGHTIFAIRLPAALLGTATIALAYGIGSTSFNRRVGIVAAGLTAVSLWPLMESRWALRAVTLTFATALTIYLLQKGQQNGRWRYWIGGGIALGLTMYTYIPSRIFPFVILAWLGWAAWSQRETISRQWRPALLSLLISAVVFAPFGLYMWQNTAAVNQRIDGLSIALEDAVEDGEWAALGQSITGVLKMFTIQGDIDWRYHLSGQPVFDPFTGIFFYMGLALCLWLAFRKNKAAGSPAPASYALLLLWAGAMLVPNAILEANPSFLRAAGAIVPVYLITAVGVEHTLTFLTARRPLPWLFPLLVTAGLALLFGRSWYHYFSVWNTHAEVREIYQADLAMMGRYLDQHPPPADTRVFIGRTYVHDSAPRTFAYTSQQAATWFNSSSSFAWNPNQPGWYVVSNRAPLPPELNHYLQWQTDPLPITYADGAAAFTLYVSSPSPPSPQNGMAVSFHNAPQLMGYDVLTAVEDTIYRGDTLTLVLHWRIPPTQPRLPNQLTYIQAILEDEQGQQWSQASQLIGYPQASWEGDDRFIQLLTLDIPDGIPPGAARFRFQLYHDEGELYPISEGDNVTASFVIRSHPLVDFTPTSEMLLFDETLVLRQSRLSTLMAPGLAMDVALDWVAVTAPPVDYEVELQLIQPGAAAPFLTQKFGIWPDVYPTSQWQPGEQVSSFHRLIVPVDIPTDVDPELRVRLLAQGEPVPITQGDNKVAQMTLDVRPHSFEVPAVRYPAAAVFGEQVRLLGYDLAQETYQAGESIELILYWQAIQTPNDNYTIFNHLLQADGQLAAQFDGPPSGEAWLMTTWLPDEVITDGRSIALPPGMANGRYPLAIGLYDGDTGVRLPVVVDGVRQENDQLILMEVMVTAP